MSRPQQGWQCYHEGNYERAAQLFDGLPDDQALAGRALSMLAMGRGEEAKALVDHRLRETGSSECEALLADVMGRQGQRRDAEQMLQHVVARNPKEGFYRTLLGEQRIRQGRWDDGTEEFIAGIETGTRRAVAHLKKVVTDMVDAVAARRIPPEDAVKFINRIDYSTSQHNDKLNKMFARARRALNRNRRLDRNDIGEPWAAGVEDRLSSDKKATSKSSFSSSGSAPPPEAPPPTPSEADTGRQPAPESPPEIPDSSDEGRSRPLSGDQDHSQLDDETVIAAKKKDMTAVMERERRRNEQLQELVARVDPPIWPSNYETPLDTIDPIGFSTQSLLKGSNDIETANFRITGGDISVEIGLERCMHNLIAAARSDTATTLPTTPESIPRLELNLLDDFLKRMPPLDELYRDQMEIERPDVMGVGRFIGECIVQSYGGSWNYQIPARESVIHLGDHVLDPIGIAEELLTDDDFDAVDLRKLLYQAERAVQTSTAFPTFTDYVDSTSGLIGEALTVTLSELWIGYRFELADTQLQQVASTLEIVEETDAFVLFSLPVQFVPRQLSTSIPGATDNSQRVRMAYLRETGEFLVLSSRKHFCRLLEAIDTPLDQETGQQVIRWLDELFRPGWLVITGEERAARCREHHQIDDVQTPQLRHRQAATMVVVEAVDRQSTIYQIGLRHHVDDEPPYQMKVGRR